VVNRVEAYLSTTKHVSIMKKLSVADKYRLKMLRSHCLSLFTTLAELKNITSDIFGELSEDTKKAVHERTLELID
ncbi:hypothetical protein PFISCL1PPCAC_17195, partial [Pristionchus fissidentatus]